MKIVKWNRSILIFCLLCSFHANAQTAAVYENSHYRYSEKTQPLTTAVTPADVTSSVPIAVSYNTDVLMPAELNIPQRRIINALFTLKTNLGDNYIYGPASAAPNAPLDFRYRISFSITPFTNATEVSGVFEQASYDFVIENNKPEALFVRNFTQFTDLPGNSVSGSDFIFQRFRIGNVTITPLIAAAANPSVQADMLAKIANSIRFEINYDIEYGIDVISAEARPVITSLAGAKQTSKQITFNWNNNGFEFPDYEFQLLRLYNNDQNTASSDEEITAEIDWNKALRIETESSKTSLTLTIAEGTGFYVWRVRPIGTFHEGGIANDLNYSEDNWSVSPENFSEEPLTFTGSNITHGGSGVNPYFYFEDPADDKNWIYSRTFTEGNKVSENLTYATPLQQVRQTQAYRASNDTTLVTQTIQDNSGRPALSTLNVPVPGKLGDFKENFVRKEGTTELFTAEDYDDAANYQQPSRVNQDGTPLGYYSNQNPDLNIPDAEGYPYQRTIYYNDGSQRVKEQSGVGKTHMIGDGTGVNGGGKTTKTFYSTPSESELIALFGDEAPDHQTVLKTITVDPNNTASISYTSKEGNVIATGLSFQDGDGTTMEPLNGQPVAGFMQTVNDAITRNVASEKGFVSSKRIALVQATPLDISYKVKCEDLELSCLNLTIDCKYTVRVVIHNIDNPAASIVLPERDLSNASVSCVDDGNGVRYKNVSWPAQNLSAGTYIIEKTLIAGNAAVVIEDAKSKAEKQIMPLIDKITGWLEGVDCEAELQEFYTNLNNIKNDVNRAFDAGTSCNAECVVSRYSLGEFILTPEHKIDIYNSATGRPQRMEISSPCCGVMSVSVAYIPPFRCPADFNPVDVNGNGRIDVNVNYTSNPAATEFSPDFEGYAMSILSECPNFNRDVFYSRYMVGWAPGDFNKMVHHMLTDVYNAKGRYEPDDNEINGNPTPSVEYDDCGQAINNPGIVCNGNECTQYTCSQLVDCWTQQIVALRSILCANGEFNPETPSNVSNRTDEEAGEEVGGGQTHNQHFDEGIKDVKLRRRKRKKLKKKIAAAMRDLSTTVATPAEQSPAEFQGYLVRDFLDCSGFKFAKILTDADPAPLPADAASGVRYNVPFNNGGTSSSSCPPGGCKRWPYNPPSNWENITDPSSGKTLKQIFPHVKDPRYAFKYFEYPEVERQRKIELTTCYVDPNDCYELVNGNKVVIPCCFQRNTDGSINTDFCDAPLTVAGTGNYSSAGNGYYDRRYNVKNFCELGKLTCAYTAEGWSSGQRYTFYTMIKSIVPIVIETEEEEGEEDPAVEVCEDFTIGGENVGIYSEANPFGFTFAEIAAWKQWNGIEGDFPVTSYPSVVQFEMMKMTKDCEGRCETRKAEFRGKLMRAFTRNGYVIGGCKGSETDNVVPEEDIDLLVAEVIAKCKLQCPVTTYGCEEVFCRDMEQDETIIGPTESIVDIEYGVGTCPDGTTKCEQKKWKQVMSWDIEFDMPSMLDVNSDGLPDGSRKFTCVPNPNMANYTELTSALYSIPDPNNFQPIQTVSPGMEINLSLPAKN